MSVNSVSTSLRPYGPLSGSNSQPARPAARAEEWTFAKARASQVTGAEAADPTQDASATTSEAADLRGFQASADRTEGSNSGSSEAPGGRSSPGIALYQRVSQYGSNEPSASALLKSWNNIVHGSGQDAESGVAAFAKALSQNDALGLESGVLDLTA